MKIILFLSDESLSSSPLRDLWRAKDSQQGKILTSFGFGTAEGLGMMQNNTETKETVIMISAGPWTSSPSTTSTRTSGSWPLPPQNSNSVPYLLGSQLKRGGREPALMKKSLFLHPYCLTLYRSKVPVLVFFTNYMWNQSPENQSYFRRTYQQLPHEPWKIRVDHYLFLWVPVQGNGCLMKLSCTKN